MKKRVTFTFEEDTIERLQALSEKTMIPQSRIVEMAIIEKIKEMEKDTN